MPGKRTSNVPADETKAQKSVRLASARMTRALGVINRIGALGNSSYELTDEQKDKMIRDLSAAITDTKSRLSGKKAAAGAYQL